MTCSRLPAKYRQHWPAWARRDTRPGHFALVGCYVSRDVAEQHIAAHACEWLVLPPGEAPLMHRDSCHRRKP